MDVSFAEPTDVTQPPNIGSNTLQPTICNFSMDAGLRQHDDTSS